MPHLRHGAGRCGVPPHRPGSPQMRGRSVRETQKRNIPAGQLSP